MVHDLVDLPLHEVLLDRRVIGSPYREEPRSGGVCDQSTLHADNPWVRPTVGGGMVSDRGYQIITRPSLPRTPMIPHEDAERRLARELVSRDAHLWKDASDCCPEGDEIARKVDAVDLE
eukprot:16133043-Heterocapsa_arctica.AAC.1